MVIDILCKVVDNYGDIGLVYRLAKALSEAEKGIGLRLHVDDLESFSAIQPEIDPDKQVQKLGAWTVLGWDIGLAELAKACSDAELPHIVVECFACGRPEALEELLFDPQRDDRRLIVNLEHLSAETWADELHRMLSATRNALVSKYIFMPGFTRATGGLVIDRQFRARAELWRGLRKSIPTISTVPNTTVAVPPTTVTVQDGTASIQAQRRDLARRAGFKLPPGDELRPWILVFSYEHDYDRIVSAIAAAPSAAFRPSAALGPAVPLATAAKPLALVAAGRSSTPFLEAWEAALRPFPALSLPFLPQELWDEVLLAADLAIVRGEESLARAALAGSPFVWHAYRQEDNYQLVKVRALLERMRPDFSRSGVPAAAFAAYEAFTLAFNDRLVDGPLASGGEAEDIAALLEALPALRPGFEAFADSLLANGDLAAHLLAFVRTLAGSDV